MSDGGGEQNADASPASLQRVEPLCAHQKTAAPPSCIELCVSIFAVVVSVVPSFSCRSAIATGPDGGVVEAIMTACSVWWPRVTCVVVVSCAEDLNHLLRVAGRWFVVGVVSFIVCTSSFAPRVDVVVVVLVVIGSFVVVVLTSGVVP